MFNIIIIDDEIAAANELAELVDYEKYGFSVEGVFGDAESALEHINSNRVDMVISDIKMSGMDGLDLLKALNKNHPHIKVVLVSAYRDFEYAKTAISYNAFEYITKPIAYEEYINVLIKSQNVLTSENASGFTTEDRMLILEEVFCDFFNNITNEDIFIEKLRSNHIGREILNAQCSLMELRINDIDGYLQNIWHHGKERLLPAINQIIPTSMFDCYVFTVSNHDDRIDLLVINAENSDYHDAVTRLSTYITYELQSILAIDASITEQRYSQSVLGLKNNWKQSTSYMVKTIMSNLINNQFDEIDRIKSHIFATANLADIQNFCFRLTEAIRANDPKNDRATFIDIIGIKSITNTSTLEVYFDELINSYKYQNENNYLEKTVILEAIHYIDTNFSKDITLASVSKHVMLNPSYFSNYFKKQTGECFSDFLLKIRMEHAKKMLRNNPKMKIHAICENVGYKSQPYFYKVFQSYTGLSPSEYRKNE